MGVELPDLAIMRQDCQRRCNDPGLADKTGKNWRSVRSKVSRGEANRGSKATHEEPPLFRQS